MISEKHAGVDDRSRTGSKGDLGVLWEGLKAFSLGEIAAQNLSSGKNEMASTLRPQFSNPKRGLRGTHKGQGAGIRHRKPSSTEAR